MDKPIRKCLNYIAQLAVKVLPLVASLIGLTYLISATIQTQAISATNINRYAYLETVCSLKLRNTIRCLNQQVMHSCRDD